MLRLLSPLTLFLAKDACADDVIFQAISSLLTDWKCKGKEVEHCTFCYNYHKTLKVNGLAIKSIFICYLPKHKQNCLSNLTNRKLIRQSPCIGWEFIKSFVMHIGYRLLLFNGIYQVLLIPQVVQCHIMLIVVFLIRKAFFCI